MFELYLDTADLEQIARFSASLPIRGITTNPTILAKAKDGLAELLPRLAELLGEQARIHVQAISHTVDEIVSEALHLHELPYDIVVKVPATETGLAAIKKIKARNIPVLATAIYSVQQGFMAALCGADYLAPYVNRIDAFGSDGLRVVAELQHLIDRQNLPGKVLPASFKNTQQVMGVLQTGVAAITLPVEIVAEMFAHPAVPNAVERFSRDWRSVFGEKLSYES